MIKNFNKINEPNLKGTIEPEAHPAKSRIRAGSLMISYLTKQITNFPKTITDLIPVLSNE